MMDMFIIQKVTGDRGRSIVAKKGKYTFVASGNIPVLYNGMSNNLDIEKRQKKGGRGTYWQVLNYNLILTDRNKKILSNNNVDVAEYEKTLRIHRKIKDKGYSWYEASLRDNDYYTTLPFALADTLHHETKNDATDMKRIEAINRLVMKYGRKHRMCAYDMDAYFRLFEHFENKGAYPPLCDSIKTMAFTLPSFDVRKGKIVDFEIDFKAQYIIKDIKKRVRVSSNILPKDHIENYKATLKDDECTPEQLKVLDCLCTSSPCIITGGAGTGKTSIIDKVIKCYTSTHNAEDILLVAPTGKAARRLEDRTGFPASTIHKALRRSLDTNLNGTDDEADNTASVLHDAFVYYNQERKLPHKLVVVDESSMIDTELMYDLLAALDVNSKVIFVGDHNQLYPVGYGEPFFDFLEMIKVYRLTKNHRQSSDTDILGVADYILNDSHKIPDLLNCSGKGVKIKEIDFKDVPRYMGRDEEGVQMISPYNLFNDMINDYLKKGKKRFNAGDKIIMCRNTPEYSNGEIGRVIETYSYDSPCGESMMVNIGGRKLRVMRSDYDDINLAYAITIHKMQGSEDERIIVFIPEKDGNFVDRRMLYTAVTRARKTLEIYYVKKPDILESGVRGA